MDPDESEQILKKFYGSVTNKFEIPVFRVVQVSESAFTESSDVVNGKSGTFIGTEHQFRIGCPVSARRPRSRSSPVGWIRATAEAAKAGVLFWRRG